MHRLKHGITVTKLHQKGRVKQSVMLQHVYECMQQLVPLGCGGRMLDMS